MGGGGVPLVHPVQPEGLILRCHVTTPKNEQKLEERLCQTDTLDSDLGGGGEARSQSPLNFQPHKRLNPTNPKP